VVIHTHLHLDHCQNDYKCVNAKFYVHEKSWNTSTPHPLDYRYVEDYLEEIEEKGQVISVKGAKRSCRGSPHPHAGPHGRRAVGRRSDVPGESRDHRMLFHGREFLPSKKITAKEMEVIRPGPWSTLTRRTTPFEPEAHGRHPHSPARQEFANVDTIPESE